MEPKERPLMPADLVKAVMEGNRNILEQRLGLAEEDPDHVKISIDQASDPAPKQATAIEETLASELQSATHFGNTILHLLVANEQHNDLAVKVFQKDPTLLTAKNKELATPLHTAAKFGNVEVIESLYWCAPDLVKNVLKETNENEDNALHFAVENGQEEVVRQLMGIDQQMAYEFNKEGLSPLHVAIANAGEELKFLGYDVDDSMMQFFGDHLGDETDNVVQIMLDVDPAAAWTQFADGTFPIHVAARMGKGRIVAHFISNNWEHASLPDPDGRNLFHIAVANNKMNVIQRAYEALNELDGFGSQQIPTYEIINAKDCKGNTPLHVAAMMANKEAILFLKGVAADKIHNNRGRTPFQIAAIDRLNISKPRGIWKLYDYLDTHDPVFTNEYFDLDKELTAKEMAERTQVIGLGSVLITAIAFAAAFTFPGGYNADNGTPVLGRRYMFRAFMLANALAFFLSFSSIFILIRNYLRTPAEELIRSAGNLFLQAAVCMVKAFGIGSYVMLAPVNLTLAIIILALGMLFGSVTANNVISVLVSFLSGLKEGFRTGYGGVRGQAALAVYIAYVERIIMWIFHSWPFLIIFGVASLK